MRIPDGKKKGSGINIPDPKHCSSPSYFRRLTGKNYKNVSLCCSCNNDCSNAAGAVIAVTTAVAIVVTAVAMVVTAMAMVVTVVAMVMTAVAMVVTAVAMV